MKTVIPYELTSPISTHIVGQMFQDFGHTDPLSQQPESIGITSVDTFNDHVHKIVIKQTKRVVPSSVIKRVVAEKAAAWLELTGNPAGRKTLAELKDDAIHDLLPKAFLSDTLHTVYLVDNLALFSSKVALEFFDDALERATEDPVSGDYVCLSSLLLSAPEAVAKWPSVLTEWATDEPPLPFQLGDRLKATGEDSSVSFQSPSMLTEFPKVANPERHVSELKLLSDGISFILTDAFVLKSVKTEAEFRDDDYLSARLLADTVKQLVRVLS